MINLFIFGSISLIATAILLLLGATTNGSRRSGIAINLVSCISLSSAFLYTILLIIRVINVNQFSQ